MSHFPWALLLSEASPILMSFSYRCSNPKLTLHHDLTCLYVGLNLAVAWQFSHRVHCITSTYSKTWMHICAMNPSRSALLQNITFKCSAVRQRLLKVQSYASVTDLQLFNWCHFPSFSVNCKYLLFRKCTSECSRCFPGVWAQFHKCHVYSFDAWAELDSVTVMVDKASLYIYKNHIYPLYGHNSASSVLSRLSPLWV